MDVDPDTNSKTDNARLLVFSEFSWKHQTCLGSQAMKCF